MTRHSVARSSLAVVVAAASLALAQPDPADPTPLVDKHYQYPDGIVSTTHLVVDVAHVLVSHTKSTTTQRPSVVLK